MPTPTDSESTDVQTLKPECKTLKPDGGGSKNPQQRQRQQPAEDRIDSKPRYTQSDFDQRDYRALCKALKGLSEMWSRKAKASIGVNYRTPENHEIIEEAAQVAGIARVRILNVLAACDKSMLNEYTASLAAAMKAERDGHDDTDNN